MRLRVRHIWSPVRQALTGLTYGGIELHASCGRDPHSGGKQGHPQRSYSCRTGIYPRLPGSWGLHEDDSQRSFRPFSRGSPRLVGTDCVEGKSTLVHASINWHGRGRACRPLSVAWQGAGRPAASRFTSYGARASAPGDRSPGAARRLVAGAPDHQCLATSRLLWVSR